MSDIWHSSLLYLGHTTQKNTVFELFPLDTFLRAGSLERWTCMFYGSWIILPNCSSDGMNKLMVSKSEGENSGFTTSLSHRYILIVLFFWWIHGLSQTIGCLAKTILIFVLFFFAVSPSFALLPTSLETSQGSHPNICATLTCTPEGLSRLVTYSQRLISPSDVCPSPSVLQKESLRM